MRLGRRREEGRWRTRREKRRGRSGDTEEKGERVRSKKEDCEGKDKEEREEEAGRKNVDEGRKKSRRVVERRGRTSAKEGWLSRWNEGGIEHTIEKTGCRVERMIIRIDYSRSMQDQLCPVCVDHVPITSGRIR